MISGLPSGMTYEQKCKEIGIDTLEKRRRNQDVLQTYKILEGHDRIDTSAVFTRQSKNYARYSKPRQSSSSLRAAGN